VPGLMTIRETRTKQRALTQSERMLDAARGARSYLPAEMLEETRSFLRRQQGAGGGFIGRGGSEDLYYTVFGIDAMHAAGIEPDAGPLGSFIRSFGDGNGLDFMHLSCLARCRARALPPDPAVAVRVSRRIEEYRSLDGGYNPQKGAGRGSIYGCFLANAACEDLGIATPEPAKLLKSVLSLRMEDGYFANEWDIDLASTNASVGALLLIRRLGGQPDLKSVEWLMEQRHEAGGIRAGPLAPFPDLVSTATGLFALHECDSDPGARFREACVALIEALWQDGGFAGHLLEDAADCEYTFYGLLSLGCLSAFAGGGRQEGERAGE